MSSNERGIIYLYSPQKGENGVADEPVPTTAENSLRELTEGRNGVGCSRRRRQENSCAVRVFFFFENSKET